ncbi:MAG: hypothetical protein B9S36_07465 [Verrucomicrobiia bacterium Tous-C2TDCM]|nr:MAG: hypothetical protein B9S36_07465 [Verrucomicrobiae bacterium Tous-C2TDCM]
MRRYWLISLAIGGGVGLLILSLTLAGGFEPLVARLAALFEARGWSPDEGWTRWRWLEMLTAVAASLGMALAVVEITRPVKKLVAAFSGMLLLMVPSPLFALYGVLFDPFGAISGALLSAIGAVVYSRTSVGKRKGILEEAVGSRVSVKLFNEMLESPLDPGFQGAVRQVTTLVCYHFPPDPSQTKNTPSETLTMGSLFLRTVSTFLLARGAYLEEAGPERVRVSFGMLRDTDDHAEQACRAGLDLRIRLRGLSQEFESRWFQPLCCGIGLESGETTVGLCGIPGQFFFAGFGGGEDFAGRLACANRRFGSELLIGPEAYRRIRHLFEVRPLEMVYDPVACVLQEIFELLGTVEQFGSEDRMRRDQFWQGVILFREKRTEEALEAFRRARLPGAGDGPLDYFTAKAQEAVNPVESRPHRLIRELTDEGHARLVENF